MPDHLVDDVRCFAVDFQAVTRAWVAQGWHTRDEVAEWRAVIRADMESVRGVDPQIDSRPRDDRIRAWCRTFGALAAKL